MKITYIHTHTHTNTSTHTHTHIHTHTVTHTRSFVVTTLHQSSKLSKVAQELGVKLSNRNVRVEDIRKESTTEQKCTRRNESLIYLG